MRRSHKPRVHHCGSCPGEFSGCTGLAEEAIVTRWARRVFSGLPLHPDDPTMLDELREFLRERAAGRTGCLWRERRENAAGMTYWLEWWCRLPASQTRYRVKREEWVPPGADGLDIRRVYEIEVTGAQEDPIAGAAGPGGIRPACALGGTVTGFTRAPAPPAEEGTGGDRAAG